MVTRLLLLLIPLSLCADRFDYIVVGSGPGGSPVARRLAEIGKSVLVLDRGINSSEVTQDWPFERAPRFTENVLGRSSHRYVVERSPGLSNRLSEVHYGFALGGSTTFNGMLAMRGAKDDWDEWRDEFGLKDWGYLGMLPFFLRLENNSRSGDLYGNDGPVQITDEGKEGTYNGAFIRTMAKYPHKNVPLNYDLSTSPNPIGVGTVQRTFDRKAARVLAHEAYLSPFPGANLRVVASALVTNIVFEKRGEAVVAKGVNALVGNELKRFELNEGGEVILSAGAIESPKLLMLSGVGPEDALQRVGIEPIKVVDGVGRNLQDHPGISLLNIGTVTEPSNSITFNLDEKAVDEWRTSGTGPLSQTAPGVIATYASGVNGDRRDTQIYVISAFPPNAPLPKNAYVFSAHALRTHSRGRITLRTSSAFNDPIVDANYFADSRDLAVIVDAARVLRNLTLDETGELKPLTVMNLIPGDAIWSLPEEYINYALGEFIRQNAIPGYHSGGTVAMGYALNEELQVPGIEGLRVSDYSVQPRILSSNPVVSIYATGEKAAVLIKKRLYQNVEYPLPLRLKSLCHGKWSVHNPNSKEAVFDWTAEKKGAVIARGQFSVGAGKTEHIFSDESGKDHEVLEVKVFVNGKLQQAATNGECASECA